MKKILFVVAFITASITFAQDSQFSDETVQKFAEAYIEVRNENMNLQLNMLTAIEDAGLTSEEFTKIHILLNDPETKNQVSDTNKRKYNLASDNIQELDKSIQESIERIIVKSGLKVETYHSIAKASQSDANLKNKIKQFIK
jgi:predicted RNA-binding protein with PUA domain